jgi:hypothetical protein
MMMYEFMEYKQKVWLEKITPLIPVELRFHFAMLVAGYFDRTQMNPDDDEDITGYACIQIFDNLIENGYFRIMASTCPFCENTANYERDNPEDIEDGCVEVCKYGEVFGCHINSGFSKLYNFIERYLYAGMVVIICSGGKVI